MGRENVVLCNVLRNQVVDIPADQALHFLNISCGLLDNAGQHRIINLLCHATSFGSMSTTA